MSSTMAWVRKNHSITMSYIAPKKSPHHRSTLLIPQTLPAPGTFPTLWHIACPLEVTAADALSSASLALRSSELEGIDSLSAFRAERSEIEREAFEKVGEFYYIIPSYGWLGGVNKISHISS